MKWHKLGQIYSPDCAHPKLLTHAANPLAVSLGGDSYRVFFSARDQENRSSVSYVDIDLEKRSILYIHPEPAFVYGPDESFYSHGVSIGNLFSIQSRQYILFMGWQNKENQHWRGDIGQLELIDNHKLLLGSTTPYMSEDPEDPVSLSYPWVMYDNPIYKMWYGSTISWDAGNNEMLHVIKYATSVDGLQWEKKGLAIPFEPGRAQAFSRPTVIKNSRGYHMWYSYRSGNGTSYRIGAAYSSDGENWQREEKNAGITVSESGWDSEMICYPFVFEHKNNYYMLYNGNGYGKTGFGLAILEEM